VGGGAPACTAAKPCVTGNPAFAWNHGDVSPDINTTWLGVVGPGVRRVGETDEIWSDHADVRPTLLSLVGLRDDYVHQGRALLSIVDSWARPRHSDAIDELGRVYKQLNAPVGALAMATLRISTKSLSSGDAAFDLSFGELTHYLQSLAARRDVLAARIEQVLDDATFGAGGTIDRPEMAQLTSAASALVEEARLVAGFVDLLP
jgi:hypothetical protein